MLSDRLRPGMECADWVITEVKKLEAHREVLLEAAAHIAEKHRIYKQAMPTCEKHKPDGGARGNCLICACIAYSNALSRISYLCGEPNEMEVSDYDVHCNEDAVVKQVQQVVADGYSLAIDLWAAKERIAAIQKVLLQIRDATHTSAVVLRGMADSELSKGA